MSSRIPQPSPKQAHQELKIKLATLAHKEEVLGRVKTSIAETQSQAEALASKLELQRKDRYDREAEISVLQSEVSKLQKAG